MCTTATLHHTEMEEQRKGDDGAVEQDQQHSIELVHLPLYALIPVPDEDEDIESSENFRSFDSRWCRGRRAEGRASFWGARDDGPGAARRSTDRWGWDSELGEFWSKYPRWCGTPG